MLELMMLIIVYQLKIFSYQEDDYWLPNWQELSPPTHTNSDVKKSLTRRQCIWTIIHQELQELKYALKSQEKERQKYEKQRQQNEKERTEAEKER